MAESDRSNKDGSFAGLQSPEIKTGTKGNVIDRGDGYTKPGANGVIKPTDLSFFNGAVAHGVNTADPYVSGYSYISWITVPRWIDGVQATNNSSTFRYLCEKNFKGFSGLSNIDLEVGAVTGGFTANELMFATKLGQKPSEFTLKYQEQSGSPLTQHYNRWVGGIRDPRTGIATYPKEYDLEYHSFNHTGTLLYVNTRPDADNTDKNIIEFAALFTHVMPKRILLEHFGFDGPGDHDLKEVEMPFSGYMNFGASIDNFAYTWLKETMWHPEGYIHENKSGSAVYEMIGASIAARENINPV
jgi:hypothetical protein